MEYLKSLAGIDVVRVPFNGSPAVTATIQNETQMLFAVMAPLKAQIEAGKLRPIAVTTVRRFPPLPDLPTIAEPGFPGFDFQAWNGILVPAGTPKPMVARLSAEAAATLTAFAVVLFGPDSTCNLAGSGHAIADVISHLRRRLFLRGASHGDFEGPTNRFCEMLRAESSADEQARIRAGTVAAAGELLDAGVNRTAGGVVPE